MSWLIAAIRIPIRSDEPIVTIVVALVIVVAVGYRIYTWADGREAKPTKKWLLYDEEQRQAKVAEEATAAAQRAARDMAYGERLANDPVYAAAEAVDDVAYAEACAFYDAVKGPYQAAIDELYSSFDWGGRGSPPEHADDREAADRDNIVFNQAHGALRALLPMPGPASAGRRSWRAMEWDELARAYGWDAAAFTAALVAAFVAAKQAHVKLRRHFSPGLGA